MEGAGEDHSARVCARGHEGGSSLNCMPKGGCNGTSLREGGREDVREGEDAREGGSSREGVRKGQCSFCLLSTNYEVSQRTPSVLGVSLQQGEVYKYSREFMFGPPQRHSSKEQVQVCAGEHHQYDGPSHQPNRFDATPSHQSNNMVDDSPAHRAAIQERNIGEFRNASPSHQHNSIFDVSPAHLAAIQERNIREIGNELDDHTSNLHSNSCAADRIIKMFLNTDPVIQKSIIIKLVSHNDICTTINEVLSRVPLETQATYNKQQVPWHDCVPPYAVDQ